MENKYTCMKNRILSLLFISLLGYSLSSELFASSGDIVLKPSLEVQMKKQEAVNKKAALAERLKTKNIKKTPQIVKKIIVRTEVKKDLAPTLTIPPVPTTYTNPTKTETGTEEIKTPTLP